MTTREALVLIGVGVLLSGCVTRGSSDAPPQASVPMASPPAEPTLGALVEGAVLGDAGAQEALKARVAAAPDAPEVCVEIEGEATRLMTVSGAPAASMAPGLAAYLLCPGAGAPDVFAALLRGGAAAQRAAWQLAAAKPSRKMAARIGAQLAKGLESSRLEGLLHDSVATAILENRVPDSYTFLRKALAASGKPSFARALIQLEPARASEAAIAYLAKASAEELRGVAPMKSVNVATCALLLEHFASHPPTLDHPNVGHLFLYAIAQDEALARPAQDVTAALARKNAAGLAAVLAKIAPESQTEYVARLEDVAMVEAQSLKRALEALARH